MSENARAYIETPVNIVARPIPLPRADAILRGPLADKEGPQGGLPIDAITSGSIGLSRAEAEAERLLERCKDRVRRGERWAVLELLDVNAEFLVVPWVRETLGRFLERGLSLRKPGRPRFRYLRNPLIVTGLVHVLIEQGRADNPEQALGLLEELRLVPSYETAKRAYFQVRRESRFRPLLLRLPEFARVIRAEETGPPGRLLGPGEVAIRELGNLPLLGPTKLIVRNEG
jgi:hypothetical protein